MSNQNSCCWPKGKLATRLGLSSRIQQIDIVAIALDALETSPLLREGFPKLPKRSPRKREDYKCGHCGMKKRNHYCVGNENGQGEENETSGNPTTSASVGQAAPPTKKRKKSFKPLSVVLLDNSLENVQLYLDEIRRVGERNVSIRVRYVASPTGVYNVVAEASWGNNKDVYIGQLSDFYKEFVKISLEDGTFSGADLAPIEEHTLEHGRLLFAQLILYRSTSWRTKRLSEIEWMNTNKKKKFKTEDEPPSPLQQEPPSPLLCSPDTQQRMYLQQEGVLPLNMMQSSNPETIPNTASLLDFTTNQLLLPQVVPTYTYDPHQLSTIQNHFEITPNTTDASGGVFPPLQVTKQIQDQFPQSLHNQLSISPNLLHIQIKQEPQHMLSRDQDQSSQLLLQQEMK